MNYSFGLFIMNINMALSMNMPRVIFSTFHRFENYYTDDMQYGDMDDHDFRALGLNDISTRVDPFTLIEFDFYHSFRAPTFGFENQVPKGNKISRQRCADILFDEMTELSATFAHGKYASIIGELIRHFHHGNGLPWRSPMLDLAYRDIITGIGTNETLQAIKDTINHHLLYKQQASFDFNFLTFLMKKIKRTQLSKFIRFEDNLNGLGISVHDVYAQEISMINFHRYAISWGALLYFKAQDHFGLGKEDITDSVYKRFRFFRIWFLLQRHREYAYKPFLTNFCTHVNIDMAM
jgi:uncharacterized protein (TIGR03034 family)